MKCFDKRPCFGKREDGECKVLSETYPWKPCPFCKEKREETNGKIYPYDKYYGGAK